MATPRAASSARCCRRVASSCTEASGGAAGADGEDEALPAAGGHENRLWLPLGRALGGSTNRGPSASTFALCEMKMDTELAAPADEDAEVDVVLLVTVTTLPPLGAPTLARGLCALPPTDRSAPSRSRSSRGALRVCSGGGRE